MQRWKIILTVILLALLTITSVTNTAEAHHYLLDNGKPMKWYRNTLSYYTNTDDYIIDNVLSQITFFTDNRFTFIRTENFSMADFTYKHGDLTNQTAMGFAMVYSSKGIINNADITIRNNLSKQDEFKVVMQESMHGLGMNHSKTTCSIMYPFLSSCVKMTVGDIRHLLRLYE